MESALLSQVINQDLMKTTRQARHEATQLFRFCHIDGLLNERLVRSLVRQIIAAKRRGYLGTLSYFRRLVKLDQVRHSGKVESARPLTAGLRANLHWARLYESRLNISFLQNLALVSPYLPVSVNARCLRLRSKPRPLPKGAFQNLLQEA
jgi:hypothetical protein